MIELRNVTKTYRMGKNEYQALKGITVRIEKGELVAIMGPSGSGKTSTMNIIGLLDHPTEGQYFFEGQDTAQFSGDALARLRNRSIGFIFQSFFLLPKLTALQNVGLPLYYSNVDKTTIKERAMAMLERVGMADHATHRPSELSGGQQQRVAIARALVGEPKFILADEPTGALDSKTSDRVMEMLVHAATGTTVVVITHDPNVASQCRRVIQIHDGLIQEA